MAWELVRLHLHNRRQPPHSKPSKPVSGDGKPHSTNFSDQSIIMQTAVDSEQGSKGSEERVSYVSFKKANKIDKIKKKIK